MKALLFVIPLFGFIIHGAKAQEYYEPQKFVVVANICHSQGKCENVRIPFDADNEVQCQMNAWASAQRYAIEHSVTIGEKGFFCMRADQHDL